MRVVEIRKIEDCFDGSLIRELVLDQPLTRELIAYLGKEGELQYFPDFARPYFRLDLADRYMVQGVEGNLTVRMNLCRGNPERALRQFVGRIENFASES